MWNASGKTLEFGSENTRSAVSPVICGCTAEAHVTHSFHVSQSHHQNISLGSIDIEIIFCSIMFRSSSSRCCGAVNVLVFICLLPMSLNAQAKDDLFIDSDFGNEQSLVSLKQRLQERANSQQKVA